MAMEKTRDISKASDDRLRAALMAGDTTSVQIDTRTNKMRGQVCRAGLGKAGKAS